MYIYIIYVYSFMKIKLCYHRVQSAEILLTTISQAYYALLRTQAEQTVKVKRWIVTKKSTLQAC